ncbi:MAG: N-acyl homoserine lactonase family protein [bacterium]
MAPIRIRPLNLGTIQRPKIQFSFDFKELFNMIEAPLIAWYIEGSDRKILVDSGGEDLEKAARRTLYARTAEQQLASALGRIGVRCEEIDLVIHTHLHWDHCGGNGHLPKAAFLVQQEELRSARNPLPLHAAGYAPEVLENTPFTVVRGDAPVAEGVSVVFTPGHTTGMQAVLVEAETGRYVICGDTIALFECAEKDPPSVGAIYVDLREYYASLGKIRALAARILPGHDPKVFEKESYG